MPYFPPSLIYVNALPCETQMLAVVIGIGLLTFASSIRV